MRQSTNFIRSDPRSPLWLLLVLVVIGIVVVIVFFKAGVLE